MTAEIVKQKLRESVKRSGNAAAFCKSNGINNSALCKVFSGDSEPSDIMCRAVGYQKIIQYKELQ